MNISLSSLLKLEALLNACIKSLCLACLGTVTVYAVGGLIPSVLKTLTVNVRVMVDGRGKDRYINGSNVIDTFEQTGQTRVDLY